MTDKTFQKLINDTLEFKNKYYINLELVEKEYIKRFGVNPSQVDDDFFIDTFHYSQGVYTTVAMLTNNAVRSKRLYRQNEFNEAIPSKPSKE